MTAHNIWWSAMLAVGVMTAGCAGHHGRDDTYSRESPRANVDRRGGDESPSAEVTRARTLIEQAEKSGGQQYAGAQIQSARSKLRLVDEVRDSHKGSRKDREITARQQAEEAAADAELAVALTARGEAEKAAAEVSAGTNALRRESVRQETDAPLQVPVRSQGVGQ